MEAAAGNSGFGIAAGWGRREQLRKGPALFGEDVLATMFQTRGTTGPDVRYVGGEVGLTFLTFRASVGAATRVAGPQEADRTIFTWGIGFHIGR